MLSRRQIWKRTKISKKLKMDKEDKKHILLIPIPSKQTKKKITFNECVYCRTYYSISNKKLWWNSNDYFNFRENYKKNKV